jgi:hypothetical protein
LTAYELQIRSAAVLAMLLRLRAQESTFKIRRSRQGSCEQRSRSVCHELEVRCGWLLRKSLALAHSEA